MKANRRGRSLREDDAGAFPVVEAILVAVIVLSAIIFFTSIQRPTTGSEVGGLDLGQFAADTLQVLEAHEFNGLGYPDWVTSLAVGDSATTQAEVDGFISEILPSGSEYSLRISNGVSTHQILPTDATSMPHGANAAEVVFVPSWAVFEGAYQSATVETKYTVSPGEVIPASDPRYVLVNPALNTIPSYRCLQDPRGQGYLRDGPDSTPSTSATARDSWWGHWHSTANATTGSTGTPGVPAWKTVDGQVPADIPLGKWRLSPSSACVGELVTTETYVNVVAPECLATPTAAQCSSPYAAYGLQLVVWFGA